MPANSNQPLNCCSHLLVEAFWCMNPHWQMFTTNGTGWETSWALFHAIVVKEDRYRGGAQLFIMLWNVLSWHEVFFSNLRRLSISASLRETRSKSQVDDEYLWNVCVGHRVPWVNWPPRTEPRNCNTWLCSRPSTKEKSKSSRGHSDSRTWQAYWSCLELRLDSLDYHFCM